MTIHQPTDHRHAVATFSISLSVVFCQFVVAVLYCSVLFRHSNMSTIIRKIISTSKAAKPVAPYNQAVVADRTVYISGCLGLCKETLKIVPGGPAAETVVALKNMGAVLEAADSGFDRVVKVTIFLNDISDFAAVNEEYKKGGRTFW